MYSATSLPVCLRGGGREPPATAPSRVGHGAPACTRRAGLPIAGSQHRRDGEPGGCRPAAELGAGGAAQLTAGVVQASASTGSWVTAGRRGPPCPPPPPPRGGSGGGRGGEGWEARAAR